MNDDDVRFSCNFPRSKVKLVVELLEAFLPEVRDFEMRSAKADPINISHRPAYTRKSGSRKDGPSVNKSWPDFEREFAQAYPDDIHHYDERLLVIMDKYDLKRTGITPLLSRFNAMGRLERTAPGRYRLKPKPRHNAGSVQEKTT